MMRSSCYQYIDLTLSFINNWNKRENLFSCNFNERHKILFASKYQKQIQRRQVLSQFIKCFLFDTFGSKNVKEDCKW